MTIDLAIIATILLAAAFCAGMACAGWRVNLECDKSWRVGYETAEAERMAHAVVMAPTVWAP